MYPYFNTSLKTSLDEHAQAEIKDVLYRIKVGKKDYNWSDAPDEIEVKKKLPGGKGSSEVFELEVMWKFQRFPRVIKIGPYYDLKKEIEGYKSIMNPNRHFTQIEAATPGVIKKSQTSPNKQEAIVYRHAKDAVSLKDPKTFEEIADIAVKSGGKDLEKATKILESLFKGINDCLYKDREIKPNNTLLRDFWNLRLGQDGVIEVDKFDPRERLLKVGSPAENNLYNAKVLPGEITATETWKNGTIRVDDLIYITDLNVEWWGNRLMCTESSHHLCFEIVAVENSNIRNIADGLRTGSSISVYGKIKSIRAKNHKNRLLTIQKELKIENRLLKGLGATVPDPFEFLPHVLETPRLNRITSLVHGDLNARNILVLEDGFPCLIDYALTQKGQTLLLDFVRLEGCLARDILPKDLSWKQHVRLQRLLAASCRLGDETIEKFTCLLTQDREELASAFRLFYTIRKASKQAYQDSERDKWYQDYLEQLFLFAHLTLKWEDQTPQALRATAAMAGAALEAISKEEVYRCWNLEDLQGDGSEIIKLLKSNPKLSLSEMANFARGIDFWKKRKRDSLSLSKYDYIKNEYLRDSAINTNLDAEVGGSLISEFEELRSEFVRNTFRNEANKAIVDLQKYHETFISLQAYIDLKGKISTAKDQELRSSFREVLQEDSLLAEQERLRFGEMEGNAINLISKQPEAVLIGDAGSGKSTVACEWEFLLSELIIGNNEDALNKFNLDKKECTLRLPFIVDVRDLLDSLKKWNKDDKQSTADVIYQRKDIFTAEKLQDLLTIGSLYVTVDSLNEVTEDKRQSVAEWIVTLRKMYPRISILVCHREYNYVPGLLPFPVVRLQKVSVDQARDYVFDYLRENKVDSHYKIAERLTRLLLGDPKQRLVDDPEQKHVRDLAQTPLFLWMIVKYYQEKQKIPKSRGQLFEDFSKWYIEERHHKEHKEPVQFKYEYTDKEILLGAIGYELVQRGVPYLSKKDIELIVPSEISNNWREILQEVIVSEMLQRHNDKLHFLHQSFQEYFAACHFLKYDATDMDVIQKKVYQYNWHDTFVILLGFAGEWPKVMKHIIETALKVNPVLTARFLRVAESIDPNLLQQFIKIQEEVLRNPQSGSFAHLHAAQALAEHGRGPARSAMIRLASDLNVPLGSRVEVLNRLTDMLTQIRFVSIKDKIQHELEEMLEQVFMQPEDPKIHHTCIDMVEALNLKNLNDYLSDFIANQNKKWSLRRSAWESCEKMGIRLRPRIRKIYTQACIKQLDQTEKELFRSSDKLDRMKELNNERCYLLKQIAGSENLLLLLKRRFSLSIHEDVEKIIGDVLESGEESPAVPNEVWAVLKVQTPDDATIDRWLSLIREGDISVVAAAHQLIKMGKQGKKLSIQKLRVLLNLKLTPYRLLIVAELISVFGDKNLAELLERFLHDYIKKINEPAEFEALARLVLVLNELDPQRGKHLIAYIIMFFFHDEKGIPWGLYPLLMLQHQLYLSEEDLKTLINRGGEYARAAIFQMEISGAAVLLLAERGTITNLDEASLQKIKETAENENRLKWQCFFAIAATKLHATKLLPWLIKILKETSCTEDGKIDYYAPSFEVFQESLLGMILRAIGYLARLLKDINRDEAQSAVDFLHDYYHSIPKGTDRQIVRGITTALGFLGEWKPMLENLGPGEPWIHEAARNIFKSWISKSERVEATRWIIQQLRDYPLVAAEVRSTLEELKKHLEDEIGCHISQEGNIPYINEIVNEIKRMDEIRNLFKNKSISAFSEKVAELLKEPLKVSKNVYFELNEFLSELVPHFPKPILEYNIRNFGEIIEKIWAFAENSGLEEKFGTNIYRWYEHHGHYSKAREILQKLIDIAKKNKDISSQAIYTNDFAFEYLLEQKEWEKAASLFKNAEELFERDTITFYNAKANYWTCKIKNVDDIEAAKRELNLILKKLSSGGNHWQIRKPYILLAKLEEQEGNIKEAIELVEKAISLTHGSLTLYPEEDREYLDKLKK